MAEIKSYKDLDVWKKSMELVKEVYLITRGFPKDEFYGLTSQMRRSAVSIPSNIAEGRTRHYSGECVQFLFTALGSCSELETQLLISGELGDLAPEKLTGALEKADHVSRMTRNLIKSLSAVSANRAPQTANRSII